MWPASGRCRRWSGPTLGGLFVDFVNWRWIFFINVPLGLLAAWMLHRHFHEDVETDSSTRSTTPAPPADLWGSSLVIFALLEGGLLWPWLSLPSLVIIGSGVVVPGRVRRSSSDALAEPMLPGLDLPPPADQQHQSGQLSPLASILIGLTSYVPLYVQGVLGTGALVAGFTLAGSDPRLADRRVRGRTALPAPGFPEYGPDRHSMAGRRRRGDAHRDLPRPPRSGRSWLDLFRHRPRDGAGRQPDAGGGPGRGGVGEPRCRHRHHHVRPLDGQRPGHRGLRGYRQRRPGRTTRHPRAPPVPPTSPPQSWTTRWARSSSGSR